MQPDNVGASGQSAGVVGAAAHASTLPAPSPWPDRSPDRAASFRALRSSQLPQRRIATVESIDVARSYVAAEVQRWQGDEGPRWRLTIAPASMRLSRFSAMGENAKVEREQEDIAGLWNEGRARSYTGGVTMTERPKRSVISAWSPESRRRMSYVLKTLDYSPLFENHGIPALVTLTMPRNWEQIAPSPKAFKALMNIFLSRYNRAWGHRLVGVWKLEFQRRGAPHVHILMTPPAGRKPGSGETFSSWLAVAWAQVCQLPELDWNDDEQRRMRMDHELMGTSIDYSKGLQGHSPDMVAAYFSKHGLFGAKDYQNDPPELWREAVKDTGGVRFWGYWALKKAVGTIDLNPIVPHYVSRRDGVSSEDRVIRRHMKKLAERQSYVRKTTVYRNKVDYVTGEIVTRKRRVNRRVKWMNGQAGFISVPDGEAAAYEVARLLAWYAKQEQAHVAARAASPFRKMPRLAQVSTQ